MQHGKIKTVYNHSLLQVNATPKSCKFSIVSYPHVNFILIVFKFETCKAAAVTTPKTGSQ